MKVVATYGEQLVRLVHQQLVEAGDKPTTFTIQTGGQTWDFVFGRPITLNMPKNEADDLPKF